MGISATLAAIADSIAAGGAALGTAATGALGGLGVGAETAGLIGGGLGAGLTGAVDLGGIGALTGAGEGLITGQAPFKTGLEGLEAGAATGFGGGLGSVLGGAAGIGAGIGGGLGGAAAGAGESAATGGNPLTGALTGAIGGYGSASLPGIVSPTIGTAAPIGGASAAGGSLSASGGQLPSGTLGSDLTGATAPLGAPVTSAPLSNIASGGDLSSAIGGGSKDLISSDFATGTNFGSPAQDAAATTSIPSGAPAGGSGDIGSVYVTPSPVAGGAAAPAASTGLGTSVAKSLGLGDGIGSFLDNHGGSILQAGIGGISSMQQNAELKKLLQPLQSASTAQTANDATLQAPLLTGAALPAGDQAAVNAQAQAQKAQVKASYANLGLSGSTMEAEALAQVDQQTAVTTGNFANQLFALGQTGSGQTNGLNESILNATLAQDADLSKAVANFAAQAMGTPVKPTQPAAA